jgi:hypothetical protein
VEVMGTFMVRFFLSTFSISEANYWSSEFLSNQSLNLVWTCLNLRPKARTVNRTCPLNPVPSNSNKHHQGLQRLLWMCPSSRSCAHLGSPPDKRYLA